LNLEITPEPTDEERIAIAAALAQETLAKPRSAWADALLPQREEREEP
jgi:hypothetical protein